MSLEPWPRARSKSRPRAQCTSARDRAARPRALSTSPAPRWRPIAVCSISNRCNSPSVWAKSRAVTCTEWPRARSCSITGRITSTCGELVRSTQTRKRETLAAANAAALAPSRREARHAAEAREARTGCPFDRYAWSLLLLTFASLTEPLVRLATQLISDLGLAGVALLSVATGVIGMPGTEPTMLFAGFNVYQGHLTLIGIFVFGLVGDMLGASVAYSIGFFGTRELIDRQGSKLHVSQKRVDRAHGWFDRHGDPVIVVSRLIPFARAGFPYAAGIARMPFWRFALLATLGSIPWI